MTSREQRPEREPLGPLFWSWISPLPLGCGSLLGTKNARQSQRAALARWRASVPNMETLASTDRDARSSAVAHEARDGAEMGSTDTRGTGQQASRPGSGAHRTGRNSPNRETAVRASQLVVSWCPPSGDLESASRAIDTLPPMGNIQDSGLRTGARPGLSRSWRGVAKRQAEADQPEAHG